MNKELNDSDGVSEALEKAVAERRANAERTQRHLKSQLQKARREGLAAGSADGARELAAAVRDGDARGLSACFWFRGLVPGLVVNALGAVLNDVLIKEAYAHKSIDGDTADFFMMSLVLPILLSVAALVTLLAKGVRTAGIRGYWRTFAGYLLGTLAVVLVLLVRAWTAETHLRLILYTN